MSDIESRLREALATISETASALVNGGEGSVDEYNNGDTSDQALEKGALVCTPKALPRRLLVKAAETAVRINPVNAPMFGPLADDFPVLEPQHISAITSKYWGPSSRRLTVSFMESTPANLRARIITHMNAWTKT